MRPGPVDRERPPTEGRIRTFGFPTVERSELSNGLSLRVVRQPRLPVVTAMLVMDAGEASLPGDRAGLAVLTGNALEGGTRGRSAQELAEALEGIGSRLGVTSGWDYTSVSLSCVADRLEDAVALLAEVVLQPSFPESEVDRFREQRRAAIRQRRMSPASLADDEAARIYYADGVPYGRPVAGTEASVAGLSRREVEGFAGRQFRPGRGALVLVGDVDPGHVASLAGGHFGTWTGAPGDAASVETRPRHTEGRVFVAHRPGAVQSEVRIGHVGVPRTTDDYFPLLVLNTILGGAFTSRLNLNLRERHGFTYGVRSRFMFRRGAGPFQVSTAVGTEVTADAVGEALGEIERLVAEGPTDDEVEAAKDYIAGVFPLRLETTAQIASRIGELVVYDLPDDYHSEYRNRVRAVLPEEVAAAARRNIRPGELSVLVVGDGEAVTAPLEALGAGPVGSWGDG